MTDWQQRVVAELADLSEKKTKLSGFIQNDLKFGQLGLVDQDLLRQQLVAMDAYQSILIKRIALFR